MATREVFLSGKAKWCHLVKPDAKYNSYSLLLYPDEESLEKINQLKSSKPGILNELKKDEDGYFIKFKRDHTKVIKGVVTTFPPPVVTNADGTLLSDTWIGNGSDVTIGIEVYTYRKGEGLAARLKSVRADNLIPYKPNEPGSDLAKQYGAMGEQPAPKF